MLDARSLLTTSARLVVEDDTHIVVSLRIPKRTVHENLNFFRDAMLASLDKAERRQFGL